MALKAARIKDQSPDKGAFRAKKTSSNGGAANANSNGKRAAVKKPESGLAKSPPRKTKKRTCSHPNCDKWIKRNGFCGAHLQLVEKLRFDRRLVRVSEAEDDKELVIFSMLGCCEEIERTSNDDDIDKEIEALGNFHMQRREERHHQRLEMEEEARQVAADAAVLASAAAKQVAAAMANEAKHQAEGQALLPNGDNLAQPSAVDIKTLTPDRVVEYLRATRAPSYKVVKPTYDFPDTHVGLDPRLLNMAYASSATPTDAVAKTGKTPPRTGANVRGETNRMETHAKTDDQTPQKPAPSTDAAKAPQVGKQLSEQGLIDQMDAMDTTDHFNAKTNNNSGGSSSNNNKDNGVSGDTTVKDRANRKRPMEARRSRDYHPWDELQLGTINGTVAYNAHLRKRLWQDEGSLDEVPQVHPLEMLRHAKSLRPHAVAPAHDSPLHAALLTRSDEVSRVADLSRDEQTNGSATDTRGNATTNGNGSQAQSTSSDAERMYHYLIQQDVDDWQYARRDVLRLSANECRNALQTVHQDVHRLQAEEDEVMRAMESFGFLTGDLKRQIMAMESPDRHLPMR